MIFLLMMSPATQVILTLMFTLLSGGLIYLLIKSIKKENIRYATLTNKNLAIDINEFKAVVNREIASHKSEFVILEITLAKIENIEKVCGEDQFQQATEEMLKRIRHVFNNSAKMTSLAKDRLWVYVKTRFKKEALDVILKTLISKINEPIVLIGSLTVEFDVNIAAVVYEQSMRNLETVAANLELTTIAAKKSGNNQAIVFDRKISNTSTEQYALFTEIQEAIKNKDFRIYYQPLVNVKTLECFSVEAYLRWQHETKGIISPDVFMPSLEHSGDINWVGIWAFDEIAKQLEYWRINNPETNFKININWSVKQLSSPALLEEVKKILRKYKIQASDFYFEIANYKAAMGIEAVAKNLTALHQLGIGIAIDNISLEVDTILSLNSGDVGMLKFNRDFVGKLSLENEGAKSIAEMVVKTAKANNILVVGEGVEDREMMHKFNELGFNLAQGYFLSKPKSPTETMASILMTPWKDE